jgi:hypothetical protein
MPIGKVIFKDKNGVHYKFPERSCKRCLKYPCLEKMDLLKSNFAAYGCKMFENSNVFEICKK